MKDIKQLHFSLDKEFDENSNSFKYGYSFSYLKKIDNKNILIKSDTLYPTLDLAIKEFLKLQKSKV